MCAWQVNAITEQKTQKSANQAAPQGGYLKLGIALKDAKKTAIFSYLSVIPAQAGIQFFK